MAISKTQAQDWTVLASLYKMQLSTHSPDPFAPLRPDLDFCLDLRKSC